MTSFQLSVTPHRSAAARFVGAVRRRLQRAYADARNVKQTDIARQLGVHRSVINRQLRGYQDMTLGRVAELSWVLGYEPTFELVPVDGEAASNGFEHAQTLFKTEVLSTETQKPLAKAKSMEMTAAI